MQRYNFYLTFFKISVAFISILEKVNSFFRDAGNAMCKKCTLRDLCKILLVLFCFDFCDFSSFRSIFQPLFCLFLTIRHNSRRSISCRQWLPTGAECGFWLILRNDPAPCETIAAYHRCLRPAVVSSPISF